MNHWIGIFFHLEELARKAAHRLFREPFVKAAFRSCGKQVHIAEKCDFKGIGNISIGDGSSIGRGAVLWTTRATIEIGKKVIIGPNVTILSGNHRTNLVGKVMADVTDGEKEAGDDRDVVIREDVWVGANAVILKGVTVAEGCVIAAGAVVTRDTEPYGIYAGVPAKRRGDRFREEALRAHLQILHKQD